MFKFCRILAATRFEYTFTGKSKANANFAVVMSEITIIRIFRYGFPSFHGLQW